MRNYYLNRVLIVLVHFFCYSIIVSATNPPVASGDTILVDVGDTNVIINVQANDTDPDDDSLITSILTGPASGGAASVLNGDSISYSPPASFVGIDSLWYVVCDTGGLCDTGKVLIRVMKSCMAISFPQTYTDNGGDCSYSSTANLTIIDSIYESCNLAIGQSTEGYFGNFGFDLPYDAIISGVEVTVSGKFDLGCSGYEVKLVMPDSTLRDYNSPGTSGCVLFGNNGTQRTTTFGSPTDSTWAGVSPITVADIESGIFGVWVLLKSGGMSNVVNIDLVRINIYYRSSFCSGDSVPIANNDVAALCPGSSGIMLDVQANDIATQGDSLITVLIDSSVAGGTATVIDNDSIYYVPDSIFLGLDTVTYSVCDTTGNCDTAIVSIRVYPPVVEQLKLDTTVCYGAMVGGVPVTVDTLWLDTTFNSLGCDSTYDTTRVQVLPQALEQLKLDTTVCYGTVVGGVPVTVDTLWLDTTFNSLGCDSIYDTTRVQVLPQALEQLKLDTTVCYGAMVGGIPIKADTFWLDTIFNSLGCDSIYDTTRVQVLPQALEQLKLDTTVCYGAMVGGIPIKADTFWLDTTFNSLGCDSIYDTTRVTVLEEIVANIDTLTTSKGCTSVGLLSPGNSGKQFEWFRDGSSLGAPVLNDSTFTAMVSGDYAVKVSSGSCEQLSGTVSITIVTLLANIDTVTSSTGCDSLQLISVGNGGLSFKWLLNGTGIGSFTPNDSVRYFTQSGNYEVIVSDGMCYDTSVSVNLTIDTNCLLLPIAFNDSFTVNMDSALLYVLQNDSNPLSDSLQLFLIDSGSGGTLNIVYPAINYTPDFGFCGSATFSYQVCNADGCDTAMVVLEVVPVDSDGDGISDFYETRTVDTDGDGINNYLEIDSDGDGIPDSIEVLGDLSDYCNPIISDTDLDGVPDYLDSDSDGDGLPDAYEWDADSNGIGGDDCDGDGILDYRDSKPCPVDLFIPEIFSPNGDGVNDVFEIPGIEQYPNNKLVIFSRWGQKVYEASPYQNDWNGTNQQGISLGDKLPEGTYYWVFFEDATTGIQRRGFVYIKR